MRIIELDLLTSNIDEMESFYQKLGFNTCRSESTSFSFQAGWSTITFSQSTVHIPYHFCFLIAKNDVDSALLWIKQHTNVILNENQEEITRFESWNANSIYFHDSDGNVVELIARHDLSYENPDKVIFTAAHILCLNEIGMPTDHIPHMQSNLANKMGTKPWKGNEHTFGTHGDQEGLILLPHLVNKKHWYPTKVKVQRADVRIQAEVNGVLYELRHS